MSQPTLLLKLPSSTFLSACGVQDDTQTFFHVMDDISGSGLPIHYGYAFADKAAALAYHAGLAHYVSTTTVDASNSVIIRTTDAGYAAGVIAGETVDPNLVYLDTLAKGPSTSILDAGTYLHGDAAGFQEFIRCTYGRDPLDGGTWQFECAVPGDQGGGGNCIRPTVGLVSGATPYTGAVTQAGVFAFASGVVSVSSDHIITNGVSGANWHNGGGGSGGLAHTFGIVWVAATGQLKCYLDGVHQSVDIAGATCQRGLRMYPILGTDGGGSSHELGLFNFGLTPFAYPIVGASKWNGQ